MKIRFVLCHRTDDLSGEIRQIFLAAHMRSLGHDVAVYAVSGHAEQIIEETGDHKITLTYFLADDLNVSPHDTLSGAMLEELSRERPDIIVVKGVDYAIAQAIFSKFPSEQLAVIIGGVSEHPLLGRSSLIYFETQRQFERYGGPAVKRVLPKFLPWEDILDHDRDTSEFDIVNVGNFDEDRKAQELLLPYILTKRVLLIGGGRKLDSFRTICRDRPNVTLPGFVSTNELFRYLSRSRLMVHCSTWDGFPRAVAEGLSAGVPVIGLSGVLDGIAPEPLVRTAPLERIHALIFDALDDPEQLAETARKAAEYMRATSTPAQLANVFQDGLDCVLDSECNVNHSLTAS